MRKIMAENQPFIRHEHTIDEGLLMFEDQPFKREIIEAVGEGHDEVDAAPTPTGWPPAGVHLLELAGFHRSVPGSPRARPLTGSAISP